MKSVNSKMNGAVIVTRVSTGKQVKHGTSLESQLEICRAKALALGLPIVAEYEDAGISGDFLLMRTGLQSALTDIQEGRANTLICANIGRYSRNREYQSSIKREVQAAGGRVVFCDMDFKYIPEGDLAFNMMGDFVDYERKLIRSRPMTGKRTEQGQQPQQSRSPYGYHSVTNAEVECGLQPGEMRGSSTVMPAELRACRHFAKS